MLDPAGTFLGKMLVEEITPVVMVLRTPLVEESCLKNGLNLVQMLNPFCFFDNIDVPVRTVNDQPYRLHKFKLRLHYASDVRQPNVEAADGRIKQVVSHASEKDPTDMHSDPPQVETILTMAETESLPSWFQIFNQELVRMSAFSEHEAFDHPVACLLVVSSKDEEPTNKFIDLFNTNQLPSLLNDGVMDPKIVKHYLLIHDNQDGSSEKAMSILSEMRGTFGSNDCGLLCINSTLDGLADRRDNPWITYNSDVSPAQGLGCFLSSDDVNEMKDLMHDLSSKHIIPHMEQNIRVLNQQVSATRKGFRNQIKNLWWRKGKDDIPDAPHGPMYTFNSIESQIRVLGDYAFMLRDYELALSNYRLLSTDYKLDKAWKRYAGAQELAGLTYYMLDQARKDAEYCMETAFTTYLRLGSSGLRNATRCGLWWAEMLKSREQYKEAAGVYFRISNEEPSLRAAVMLEQASYCYLLSNPPMLRKYGFHLILAGNHYYKSDQRKHAIRAYRSALSIYKGNTWNYINDHVHFHIGKWYAVLGIFDVAFKHMLEVVSCSHQSVATQELFLRDFLQVVQRMGKTFEVFRLQLPIINMTSLKVIFEDHRTYSSPTAANARESLWRSLEEDMVPMVPSTRTNWLDSQPKYIKKYKDSNVCVAGEAIKVDIEFRNPLQIPLSVSSVSLICQLSAENDATESGLGVRSVNDDDAHFSTSGIQHEVELQKLKKIWELNAYNSSLVLSEMDFSLRGCETTMVQLTVTPREQGILRIVGVRWKFSDSVVGYHNFDPVIEKRKVKGRRARQSATNNLEFTVIKSLPKLEGCILNLPKKAYAGDLQRLVLELRNTSQFSVKNIKMKISHPRFLIPGNFEDLEAEFPACLEKQKNSERINEMVNSVRGSNGLLFSFPEHLTIQGGTTFLWPLWLRAGLPGNISLYISVYYEMESLSSDMRFRTLRMHYDLEVFPSLDVSVLISPCPSRLQDFLVRMDIVNRTSTESYQLNQLSSVESQWEISSLLTDGPICPSETLIADQAISCFFKLKKCSESPSEGTALSRTSVLGSDVRLGCQGNEEPMFDISKTPLADFHNYERLHQVKSNQEDPSVADFILISKQQENKAGPLHSPSLYSHHVCHCSIASTSPVWWLIDGPKTLNHDFSVSFCEIKLRMRIYNSSNADASVRINTFDSASSTSTSTSSDATKTSLSSSKQAGWQTVSLTTGDTKLIRSDSLAAQFSKSASSSDGTAPFIWSASSSTRVKLGPLSTTEVPLQICLFSPGTYDLSNYSLSWSLLFSDDKTSVADRARQSLGTSQGHPYYLTVLQSPR